MGKEKKHFRGLLWFPFGEGQGLNAVEAGRGSEFLKKALPLEKISGKRVVLKCGISPGDFANRSSGAEAGTTGKRTLWQEKSGMGGVGGDAAMPSHCPNALRWHW